MDDGGPGVTAVKELLGTAEAAEAAVGQVQTLGASLAHSWAGFASLAAALKADVPTLPAAPTIVPPEFIGFGATDPEEHAREMGQ